MQDATTPRSLPLSAGLGYKARHYADLTTDPGPVSWLEIHAENYMGDGGRPLAQLRNLSEEFPISLHGVRPVSYSHLTLPTLHPCLAQVSPVCSTHTRMLSP